jgi:hypothetical protein
MELRNFRLEEPSHAIALEGLGRYWDLHAYADLVEVRYFTVENTVEFHWRIPEIDNPWGDEKNRAKGCVLRFTEVRFLKILQAEEKNTNEDDCIASISQVTAEESATSDPAEFRMKREWKANEDFGLLIELQSGRTIEIHAQSAELIPA